MTVTIKRALKTLQGYCDKHLTCRDCPLSYRGESPCIINTDLPMDWDIDGFFKQKEVKNEL